MKRFFILVYLACFIANGMFAQATQNGIVKEYNERLEKTPLNNVEITISNAASTVSDEKGNFLLQFRTLKPGDKVNVRRIEKLGYEIFNKEALEQWFISRENRPFTIIMCKSERFKRIRDNYSRVSSASYEKQLKKEESRLEAERKAGKLKDAEYAAALKKLNEEYDRQLENLDNYVDRFARIDLSELSAVEAEIINLVQDGKIEEAIRRYEQQNLEEKYKEQVAIGRKAQTAINTLTAVKNQSQISCDSLIASIHRKNETLRLAGGKDNFLKIGESLKFIMDVDSTNFKNTVAYAEFLSEQNLQMETITIYTKVLEHCDDIENRISIIMRIGEAYRRIGDLQQNKNYLSKAEQLLDTIQVVMSERRKNELYGVLYCGLGGLYYTLHDSNLSESYYKKALNVLPVDNLSHADYERLINVYANLGMQYTDSRKDEEAINCYLTADSLCQQANDGIPVSPKQLHVLYVIKMQLASSYGNMKQYDKADELFSSAEEIISKLVTINPQAYLSEKLYLHNNWGTILLRQKLYVKAEMQFQMAYDIVRQFYKEQATMNNKLLTLVIGGALANAKSFQPQKWDSGKALFDEVVPQMIDLYENVNGNMIKPYLVILYQQYAFAQSNHGDYENALQLIDKAIMLDPNNANSYDSKGEILFYSGKVEAVKEMWHKVLQLDPDFLKKNESDLHGLLYKK